MLLKMKKKEPDERRSELAFHIKETGCTAVSLYAPEIGAVCLRFANGEQVSESELVRLLDGVLGFCFEEEMVELFRKLCRAALRQHPRVINEYVLTFRDLWDEEN